MILTTGKYFDGISSRPQEVELQLDEINAELRFSNSANEVNHWAVGVISLEHTGDTLEIRCIGHSLEHIKVNDDNFVREFMAYLQSKGQITWYQRLIQMGIKAHLSFAIVVLAIIVAGYLLVIPWVAEKAVMIVPRKFDISMGDKFYQQYLKTNSIDSARTKALNLFADQLNLKNTHPIHFTVIRSSAINAFALPDGNIIVFTGIIDGMKDYEELAGLICHEVSHVNNRHSMKMLCRSLSGYLFISVVGSDVNGIKAIIGDNINNFQTLSYSRHFERQADEQGTDLMMLNGINPLGMIHLFTRLKSSEKGFVPAFISTHPITADRIAYLNRRINKRTHVYIIHPVLEELFLKVKE